MSTPEHTPTSSTHTATDDIPLGFGGVGAAVGDHIAHFFRGDEQRFSVLGPYIETGLRRGDRCVFIPRPATSTSRADSHSHSCSPTAGIRRTT